MRVPVVRVSTMPSSTVTVGVMKKGVLTITMERVLMGAVIVGMTMRMTVRIDAPWLLVTVAVSVAVPGSDVNIMIIAGMRAGVRNPA